MKFLIKVLAGGLTVFLLMIVIASSAPRNFPTGSTVHIAQNTSLSSAALLLTQKNIITSPFLFKVLSVLGGGLQAGDYVFEKPQSLWKVAKRLSTGDQQLVPVKITIPEGSNIHDIAWILLKNMPDFNAPYFVKIALPEEGYLFPNTYLFYPNATPTTVFKKLRNSFDLEIKKLEVDLKKSDRTLKDVVIMASLLEREARTTEDRAIISGILWKRLDQGMPLQVDATLVYLTGDSVVTIEHTKIDSPYNTYKYTGLPKGPIANPGFASLKAALNPTTTPYFYYLSDPKGKMYYASTYAGHLMNREKYLR